MLLSLGQLGKRAKTNRSKRMLKNNLKTKPKAKTQTKTKQPTVQWRYKAKDNITYGTKKRAVVVLSQIPKGSNVMDVLKKNLPKQTYGKLKFRHDLNKAAKIDRYAVMDVQTNETFTPTKAFLERSLA